MTLSFCQIACIQTNTQNHLAENLAQLERFIRQAVAEGAEFVALPENAAFMSNTFEELVAHSFLQESHPALITLQGLAEELKIWLLIGSLAVKLPGQEKLSNRCFLLNPEGKVVCYYDKIHLYDVQVKGGESHQESARFIAGNRAVLATTPWGKLGLTICYDVRFPHLFRTLAQHGARMITVPAAFTHFTGAAHWHTLLRARAIENGCFIIAPAQTGRHPRGRRTFGHSLVVSPWGDILSDGGEDAGVFHARLDIALCEEMRQGLPSLMLNAPFHVEECTG